KIWEGGIVFYGSALGGVVGFGLFYWFVLRRRTVQPGSPDEQAGMKVGERLISGWRLADAMAPVLALGLAIGRIGCYLNGCCWGQVAIEDTTPVPLGGAHYPLLPAHCRDDMVRGTGLQTSTGFTIVPRDRGAVASDPRSVVQYVEKDSPAEKAGLKPGDRIVGVNGKPNAVVLQLVGSGSALDRAWEELQKQPGGSRDGAPEYAIAFD